MGDVKHIFLAEDDDDDSQFFYEAVTDMADAANVVRAKDGIELMQFLHTPETRPDIIFLDINMPRKNGFQCLNEIRANQQYKELPVIVFSTSSAADVINNMYDAGANAFVVKPSDFNEWKTIIKKVMITDWKAGSKPDLKNFPLSIS